MANLASGAGLAGALVLALGAAVAGWMTTRWVTAALSRRHVLDHPNERSSHSAPTPRGGGIAILVIALPLAVIVYQLHRPTDTTSLAVIALTAALAVLSWFDDLRGLPVVIRFTAHTCAAGAALALMPNDLLVFQGVLPLILDRVAAAVVWVWFINLYNFMDGIDGLSGVETVSICGGLFAIVATIGPTAGTAGTTLAETALVTGAATLGFLVLNWQPARVFMGDVGAIALGYLLGWFLLTLAAWGYWVAAVVLPGYYLADATITLARRALTGEPVWQAHAKHFYQRAVQRGLSHARVARFVLAGNVFLAILSLLSTRVMTWTGEALCLAGGVAIVAIMLAWLTRAPSPVP